MRGAAREGRLRRVPHIRVHASLCALWRGVEDVNRRIEATWVKLRGLGRGEWIPHGKGLVMDDRLERLKEKLADLVRETAETCVALDRADSPSHLNSKPKPAK